MTGQHRKVPACKARQCASALLAVCFLIALAPLLYSAAAGNPAAPIPRDNPETMVRVATSRLLDVAKDARDYAGADPERYYAAVEQVLHQVVDMRYFARGVMATYASARLYKSLQTDAERAAFRDRFERFSQAIERVFMVKYAEALLTFEGERIDVATVPGDDNPRHSTVQQTIYDSNGETYHVQYSLHRDNEGGWLVYNVIVEDINLGQIYRNQFAEAVESHHGDVDYVVDHWEELMTAQDATQDAVAESDKQ